MLRIKERLQIGDTFLFSFNCPNCRTPHLEAYPFGYLECCGTDISEEELKFQRKRLIVGTRRKRVRLSKRLVQKLIALQGFECAYCKEDLQDRDFHIDHVVPVSAGGTNDASNLCVTCVPCNLVAGSKVFASIVAKQAYILACRKIFVAHE